MICARKHPILRRNGFEMNSAEAHSSARPGSALKRKSDFGALVTAVVAVSVADLWNEAVDEWEVVGLEEDPEQGGVCICGQVGLVKLFTISNGHTAEELNPIGSSCITLFERSDMELQVKALSGLFALRNAIRAGDDVTLTSDYFSRLVLDTLRSEGAFPGDRWNKGDGGKDHEFLLKMFNKREKSDISVKQQNKIDVLLAKKIVPFVLGDARLK